MEEFFTHKEAAEFLKISERTLDMLVMSDNPPPCLRVGSQRRYYKEDLIEWARANKKN